MRVPSACSPRAFLIERPATIIYVGDHDASGRGISDRLESEVLRHDCPVTVVRVAVNPFQIALLNLPTRPGKQSDPLYKKFAAEYGDAAVELDAMSPDTLTAYVEAEITCLIDWAQWKADAKSEEVEWASLDGLMANLDALGIDTTR